MRPFLTNPTKRIVSASASVVASLASVCSISLLAGSAVTLTTLLSAQSASAAFSKTEPIAVRGEIVLWVPAGISSARVTEIADGANCVVVQNIGATSRYYLLRLKSVGTTRAIVGDTAKASYKIEAPSTEVLAAIEAIKAKQPDALADPNYVRRPSRVQAPTQQGFIPNDTFYPEHWDKRMINMPVGWAFQNGSRSVIVADIDTGFDVGHPDFFRAGMPIYIDPINTALTDPVGNPTTTNVNSPDGHGVHTAGTIAAVTNNNEGVSGVAGYNGFGVNVQLFPIRASLTVAVDGPDEDDDPDHDEELFFDSAILLGILKSVEAGAVAINMSLGGFGASATQSLAITDAINAGTLVVAATGNDFFSADTLPAFPANYPGVIAVSSVNHLRQLSSFSNYGGNTTIAAPGGDFIGGFGSDISLTNAAETRILSTFPRNLSGIVGSVSGGALVKAPGYAYTQGTSMACPQVTGAVALLAAGGATPAEIPGILTETATPLPDTKLTNVFTGVTISSRSAFGAGLLNVARALQPRIRILGGEGFGDTDFLGSSASDIGSTYFRNQTYDVRIGGIGNLIREIGSNGTSSLTYRLEEATRPTSPLQNVTVSASSLPAPGNGESPFVTKAFPLPVAPTRLRQNRYKASLILNYRGITSTQTQFFEVLDYNQPIGLTLFSVPFTPARTGVTQEQQVLTVGSGFAISRYDPLNPLGPQNDGYARYQPGDGGRTDVYARFDNTLHSKDLRTERTQSLNNPGVPLSYAVGNPAVSLAPIGVGYWVNMSETRVLETDGTPATSPVAIPLYGVENQFGELTEVGGWNLIGAPFPYPVNWSAVTVRQQTPVGVRDYSLQEAIAAEIINAQLVGWDVTTRSYYYNVFPGGQLLPFRAYWVRALKDCTLIVPPNRSKQSLISRAANTKAGSDVPQGEGWRVRLSASVAGDRDAENYIGQVQGATEGEDRYDVPKPPTGPSHSYVRFLNTDRRGRKAAFAYDMRPAATGRQKAEWTMAVGAGKGDTDVTLTWDGLRNLPSRSKLVLKDTVTGKIISMNGRSSYTYKNTEAGATRMFTVSLGTQNTAGPLQIRNIRTVAASGGRAEQRGLNVRFALSQDADVQARIKTLSGKVVDVLSGATRGVGQQEMVLRWRGRTSEGSEVPSGPYVLEITARTDEGETVTVKRPITYLQ